MFTEEILKHQKGGKIIAKQDNTKVANKPLYSIVENKYTPTYQGEIKPYNKSFRERVTETMNKIDNFSLGTNVGNNAGLLTGLITEPIKAVAKLIRPDKYFKNPAGKYSNSADYLKSAIDGSSDLIKDAVTVVPYGYGLKKINASIKAVRELPIKNKSFDIIKEAIRKSTIDPKEQMIFNNRMATYKKEEDLNKVILNKKFNKLYNDLNNPSSIERMNYLGINADRFLKNKPMLITKQGAGSYAMNNFVNIDADQIKNLKFATTEGTMAHEMGHVMQATQTSPKMNFVKTDKYRHQVSQPLRLDRIIQNKLQYKNVQSPTKSYITDNPVEPFAHALETKQGMLDLGILKDRAENIDVKKLRRYVSVVGNNDRLISVLDKNKNNYETLSKILNLLPSTTGAVISGGIINEVTKKPTP